jgi:hypothetical protein
VTVSPIPTPRRRRAPELLIALVLVLGAVALLIQQGAFRHSNGIHGSGVAASETRSLAPFTKVDLAGSNDVTVHVGGKQSVVVRADHNLLGRVTTDVRSGSLVIGTIGSFSTQAPMRVEITVPALESLTLSGSGLLAADEVKAPRLTVTLAGSGVVRASGAVNRLDVSLTGSGDAQLGQLVARDVRAALDASGRIVVNATRRLDASLRGSGAIFYTGNPAHVTKNVSGSGAIIGS